MNEPRRANALDAPACAAIVHGWVSDQPWLVAAQPSLGELTEMIAKGIPEREFWIIGAPVAGYLSLKEDEAMIAGLYTAIPGSGAGKRLLDKVKTGRTYLQLWTHEPNDAAHRFYVREGFAFVERKAEGRGDSVAELRMEWRA
ncbi:MAG: GNAT family N-acetyltransferase [Pseudomonadota bacterium]